MQEPAFADLVVRYMDRYSMTQIDLGHACGLSQSTVSKVLNGQQKPSPPIINAFVKAFKLSGAEKDALTLAAIRGLGFEV